VSFSQFIGNLEAMTMVFTGLVTAGMLYYWWSKTRVGRQMIDWVRVHTPVIGTMFVDAAMTRSMRIMSTTLNTGVNLLEAISVIRTSSSNYYIQRLWSEVDVKIRDGYQLSDSITCSKDKWLVSVGIIQMLRAGEKSGKLGYVCDKASVFYEKKLESSIKTTTALIEPMMILIMGIIIGTIAVALLLPVFRISTVLSQ
jgi:type IV pilus assembly protein PilC